jgi:hypothetical protein
MFSFNQLISKILDVLALCESRKKELMFECSSSRLLFNIIVINTVDRINAGHQCFTICINSMPVFLKMQSFIDIDKIEVYQIMRLCDNIFYYIPIQPPIIAILDVFSCKSKTESYRGQG